MNEMCKGNSMENKNFSRDSFEECVLCPRNCGSKRTKGEVGICNVASKLKVARAALHFWEEPCISGSLGSGAVFFSGCSLHCVFCQNKEIAHGQIGKIIEPERLSEIFLELQEKGTNNINLITPGHYVPHLVSSIESARRQGLGVPIVYNTSAYEKVDTLKQLEGIVDVYLPDFKYFDKKIAAKYSKAEDYPQVAREAIAEMVRQQPNTFFYPEEKKVEWKKYVTEKTHAEVDEGLLIGKGVIVRQLLLPGMLDDAKKIVRYLYQTYGNQIYISMLSQFTPLPYLENYPELMRKVSENEYEAYINFAIELGVERGFIQEGDVAEESFIPDFNCEGV